MIANVATGPAEIAERLQRLRVRHGLTQARLATLLGVSAATVIRWEHRQTRPMPAAWARVLALEGAQPADGTGSVAVVTSLPTTGPAPSGDLPARVNAFVGRERELAALSRQLQEARLLTLTGTGGVGKTRLALELADRVRPGLPDGVFLVELAPLRDPTRVAGAVATALGAVDTSSRRRLTDVVTDAIGRRRLLLVLDNCEHLVDECARLTAVLLRACPALQVLATSREPLSIAGEVVAQVPPLPLEPSPPGRERLRGEEQAQRDEAEAAQLFLARARERVPEFVTDASGAEAVSRICRRLDGLPLAIEMAAAWIVTLTPEEIAARLDRRLELLTSDRRDAEVRHRSLRAALEWSHELLGPAEAALFARLAVFAGSFDLAAAEALGEPDQRSSRSCLALLRSLVDKSLLAAEAAAGGTRHHLLETVREYALEVLSLLGLRDETADRHAEHYFCATQLLAPELAGAGQQGALDSVARDYENIRAALGRFVEQHDADRAQRLAQALYPFWDQRGLYAEGSQWLERAAGCSTAPSDRRAESLRLASELARRRGDYAAAQRLLGGALIVARLLPGRPAEARVRASEALLRFELGDHAGAERIGTEALAIFRAAGDVSGLHGQLHTLGLRALVRCEFETAQRLLEEAHAIARGSGRDDWQLQSLNNLAYLAYERGELAVSRGLTEEYLGLARKLDRGFFVGYALGNLAHLERRAGNLDAAQLCIAEAARLTDELGVRQGVPSLLNSFALLAVDRGAPRLAARIFGKVELLCDAPGGAPLQYFRADTERARAACTAALGEAGFRAVAAAGAATPLDRLWSLVLAGPDQSKPPSSGDVHSDPGTGVLTPREVQVLRLLAEGLSTKEIAHSLVVSTRTVERHLSNLYNKIDAHNRAEATAFALSHGSEYTATG